jgi:hypothetical protein
MMRGGGNMQKMMKEMQKMQKDMEKEQQTLEEKEYVGVANDDLVKITMTGKKEVVKVEIDEMVVDPEDVEILQDLVQIAVNDVVEKIENESQEQMSKYTDNLNIPGF